MSWQPINEAPMHTPILVAFHGAGQNMIQIVRRTKQTGLWGDFGYINSHYGEPKYWASVDDLSSYPLALPPDDIAGPECGCDGCTEEYYGANDD